MADHQIGTMDITAQKTAFNGLITALKIGSGVVIAVLVLLALANA